MPMLVVNNPESPPIIKSREGVLLIVNLNINSNVNTKRIMLTIILNRVIFIERKIKIPNGTPIMLPIESRFKMIKSISAFIFQISDTEIINERMILI